MVGEARDGVVDVPLVAEVGVVVIVREGLGSGLSLDIASTVNVGEGESNIIGVFLSSGKSGGPHEVLGGVSSL